MPKPVQAPRPKPNRQRGIALLLTLVTAALVVSLAMVIFYRQSQLRRHVDDYETMEVAWHYVDAMEQYAISQLTQALKNKNYVYLKEFGKNTKVTYQLSDGTGWPVVLTGELSDLQGRFNLNNLLDKEKPQEAQVTTLKSLVKPLGISESFSDVVLDWIDKDTIARSAESAESDYYASQAIPYLAANSPLVDPSELRLLRLTSVDGSNQAQALEKLLAVICTLPTLTKVNINSASPTLLNAMGFPADKLELPYKDLAKLRSDYPAVPDTIFNQLDVSSNYFLLSGEVKVDRARVIVTSILTREGGKPWRVLMHHFAPAYPPATTTTKNHASHSPTTP
jgi:general secretion pathway protein K